MRERKEKPEGLFISDEKWEIIMSEVMDNKPILFSSKSRGLGMSYTSREIAKQLNRPFVEICMAQFDMDLEMSLSEDSYYMKMFQTENAIIALSEAQRTYPEFIDSLINKKELLNSYTKETYPIAKGVTIIVYSSREALGEPEFLKGVQKIEFSFPDREKLETFAKREYPNVNEKSVKTIIRFLDMINSMHKKTGLVEPPSIGKLHVAFEMLEDGLSFDEVFYSALLLPMGI